MNVINFRIYRIAAPLPGTDEDGNKVIVCKLNDTDTAKFNYPCCVKWLLITAQVAQWNEGIQNGYIIVYDAAGFTMSHLLKCSLGTIKNYINWGNVSAMMVVKVSYWLFSVSIFEWYKVVYIILLQG